MEIRCKDCRFKFNILFDPTQAEMIVNCPRCGTPQVINIAQAKQAEKEEAERREANSAGKSAEPLQPQEITTVDLTGKSGVHTSTTPQPSFADTDDTQTAESAPTPSKSQTSCISSTSAPTPSASLKVSTYKAEEKETSYIHRYIIGFIILIILALIAIFADKYIQQQQIESEKETQTLKLFDKNSE